MSQIENKMDGFVPFGGKAQYEYQEDELAIPIAIDDAVINALDDIMFPMDEQRERPLDCQTYFAVQRTSGVEGNQDYFLLSDAEDVNDELPFSRNGASWGECNGELACKAYSEPPTLLTFHELAPSVSMRYAMRTAISSMCQARQSRRSSAMSFSPCRRCSRSWKSS